MKKLLPIGHVVLVASVCVGFCFFCPRLTASIYYVSTSGNDSNSGAKPEPWLTPKRAAEAVAPGDTVVILPGIYYAYPPWVFSRSGTPDRPITITGAAGASFLSGLHIEGDYCQVLNLTIGTTKEPLYNYMFRLLGRHDLASNCVVSFPFPGMHDVKGLVLGGTNDVAINCSLVNFSNSTAVAMGGASNLVTRCLVGNSWNLKAFVVFGVGNTISHNMVSNIQYVRYPDNSDQHPDFVQSFGDNAGLSCSNFVAEANYVINCAGGMHMFYLSIDNPVSFGKFDGFTIRNNIFVNAGNSGDTGFPHTRVCNNLFYHCAQNQGQAIWFFGDPKKLGVASNSLCLNNIFIDCGRDPSDPKRGYVQDDGVPGGGPCALTDFNYVCNLKFRPLDSAYWQRSFGAHTINGGNPRFFNIKDGTFRLSPESELTAGGTNLTALFCDDYAGDLRPATGPWQIGPYASAGFPTGPNAQIPDSKR
jgi:hypothetical protein